MQIKTGITRIHLVPELWCGNLRLIEHACLEFVFKFITPAPEPSPFDPCRSKTGLVRLDINVIYGWMYPVVFHVYQAASDVSTDSLICWGWVQEVFWFLWDYWDLWTSFSISRYKIFLLCKFTQSSIVWVYSCV